MVSTKKYDINLLRDFSSIFTRSEVFQWFQDDFTSLDLKIQRYSKLIPDSKKSTYLNFVKYAYQILENQYQNEYVYKNSFLNQCLAKELKENNTKVFSEFRVGDSVADLAIFNGISKAFEIKTLFDSDKRLARQIKDYKKAFNEVYLIIPKSKFPFYKKYQKDVGIILFDDEGKKFELISKPDFNYLFDFKIIMHILHTKEYKEIVKQYFGDLPVMNSFNQFNICFDLIKSIPIEKLNQLYLGQIKKRKTNIFISSRYFTEFNQISLALKLEKKENSLLINKLRNSINV